MNQRFRGRKYSLNGSIVQFRRYALIAQWIFGQPIFSLVSLFKLKQIGVHFHLFSRKIYEIIRKAKITKNWKVTNFSIVGGYKLHQKYLDVSLTDAMTVCPNLYQLSKSISNIKKLNITICISCDWWTSSAKKKHFYTLTKHGSVPEKVHDRSKKII